jgi:hypothetical protein
LGRPAGAAGAIPSELVTGLAGEGRGKGARVARGRFGSALGVGRPGAARSTEGAGGCRCGQRSGEGAGLAGQSGVREAAAEGCGGECAHEWQSGDWEGEFTMARHGGAVAARCAGRRGHDRAWGGAAA